MLDRTPGDPGAPCDLVGAGLVVPDVEHALHHGVEDLAAGGLAVAPPAHRGRARRCALGARLCLSGHGRTFTDVQGHIAANRELIGQRLGALEDVLRADGSVTAFDAVPRVFGEAMTPMNANWWLSETLCYLRHLQVTGRAEGDGASPERWRIAA